MSLPSVASAFGGEDEAHCFDEGVGRDLEESESENLIYLAFRKMKMERRPHGNEFHLKRLTGVIKIRKEIGNIFFILFWRRSKLRKLEFKLRCRGRNYHESENEWLWNQLTFDKSNFVLLNYGL